MRPIKITEKSSTERDKAFAKLIAIAKTKELSDEESQKLLDEIRSGNAELIEKLVNSFEMIILKVARQIQTDMGIEEMIETGKESLIGLAKTEVNNSGRERFFRFAAFHIRSAIFDLCKNPKNL